MSGNLQNPIPTFANMTGSSFLDTYGPDAVMVSFMCLTVVLAGIMVLLALIPWDGPKLRFLRLIFNFSVFILGGLLIALGFVFYSDYNFTKCDDWGRDCCADIGADPSEPKRCSSTDQGYEVKELSCENDKDIMSPGQMDDCQICEDDGNRPFTCEKVNKFAICSIALGAFIVVFTPCVDSMRVRK